MDYDDLLNKTEGLRAAAAPAPADPTLITILDALQKSTQVGIDGQAASAAAAADSAATAAANQAALTAALNSQAASAATTAANQVALTTALDKVGNASSVLKPSQPHFNPQGNLEDYLRYKDWRRQFNLFIKRVPDGKWAEKSEWLKNSVKGKAYLLITSCADDQTGYEGALTLLDKKYQQTDYIREALFEFIHNF